MPFSHTLALQADQSNAPSPRHVQPRSCFVTNGPYMGHASVKSRSAAPSLPNPAPLPKKPSVCSNRSHPDTDPVCHPNYKNLNALKREPAQARHMAFAHITLLPATARQPAQKQLITCRSMQQLQGSTSRESRPRLIHQGRRRPSPGSQARTQAPQPGATRLCMQP